MLLYSRYKNFIRDTEKTGSGGDVWENAPKFCNEIRAVLSKFPHLYCVSYKIFIQPLFCSKEAHAVHPTFVADSINENQVPGKYKIEHPTAQKKEALACSSNTPNKKRKTGKRRSSIQFNSDQDPFDDEQLDEKKEKEKRIKPSNSSKIDTLFNLMKENVPPISRYFYSKE